ncbi:DUF1963 domain-containing protein [Costertonia aggregata]|uniref:DUF1963 domain-containing protein n=1 Tax=Costertonia aggregata TaxID=343403 RepID=A0A7H9ARD5_9FLAO|nr:DUF1963 domain-containing protein [Costertonia aggregata]QLG46004.1 DUF1963 domain-containing protein [Costertonia aggregata]
MMKKIAHPLFEIQIPGSFELRDQSDVGIWAENRDATYENQWPLVSAVILRLNDLNDDIYKGDTWQERFEDSCLSIYFKSEKLSGQNKKLKGFDSYVVKAHTDATFQKTHFKINYLFAAIILDDDHYLEFRAVHEKTSDGYLEAWAIASLDSLEIFGDASVRSQAWRMHLIALEEEERAHQDKLASMTHREPEKKVFKAEIPKDGKEVFKVGDFDFEFVAKETNISIGAMSRDIQLTIKAKTKEVKKAIQTKVLDDYPGDGTVTLTFPAKGIHENGQPKGQMYFEEEKTNAPLFLHARSEGFDYTLAFSGSLTFDNGWVLLKGEMTKSYHNKAYPIFVAKKMDMSVLKWSDYRFSSMEEAYTASPNEVRYLLLQNPSFTKLPEALFGFKNLEELTIHQKSNSWEEEKLPFNQFQKELGQLVKLKKLHISGAALEQLPESIGLLTDLEQLNVSQTFIQDMPNSIWQLPKLKYLWLSSNKLTSISDTINLPSLQNISLDKNELTTLPESLAKQPQLKRIKLEGNPLEHLPEAFNAIKEIELSMEDKLRLLDFDYKGADENGLVAWDDSVFWSHYDDELVAEIDLVIKENELEEYDKALKPMVKKAVGFKHISEEDYKAIGNHRFGGMPDLPENIPYPRFGENWREGKNDYIYEFIGQINCAEIAHLQDYLPRTGTLFFFLETMHNIYGGVNNPGKIIYVEDNAKLASGKRFNFTDEDYFEMFDEGYQGFKVSATKMNSAPSFYASYANKHLFSGESAKIKDDDKLLDALYDTFENPINEKNPFEYAVNAHGFTQHEAPELQASLAKKGNPEDWVTLLVVTSAGDMQWSDAGDIFYVIHKSDLAKKDFSNVFVTLESS